MGFARWNLNTLAPLVWWQIALSTSAGTLAAMPYLLAVSQPAVAYRVSFPALARAAFGVRGAAIVRNLRGLLGLALVALTTLIGGEATYQLWGELAYVFADGAPLPSFAPAAAYGAFWALQLVATAGKAHGKRVLALGRAAAVVALAYLAWSWNAGDAALVWNSTMNSLPSVSAGMAAFAPDVPSEFWKHAAMTAGVWMTVGTFVPDHVQRMASTARAARSMIFALPPLAGGRR